MRRFLRTIAVGLGLVLLSADAWAAYPEKPVTIIAPYGPGGSSDLAARLLSQVVPQYLGKSITVENRTGSFGAMPGEIVKKAAPDGSELALLSSTTLISRLATNNFPFDPVKDLAPITKVGNFSIAFAISPTLGVDSFKDYLDWMTQGDATRRRIAVSSNTTFVEVLNILLRRSIGVSLEPVFYRGVVPILGDLRDGRIPATVNTVTSLLPPHRGRRARIVMITGARRLSAAPAIPTAQELGYPTLDMEEWFAFFASPATPPSLVAQLNRRLRTIIEDSELIELLKPLGLEVETSSPEELTALIDTHRRDWQARFEATGIKAAEAK